MDQLVRQRFLVKNAFAQSIELRIEPITEKVLMPAGAVFQLEADYDGRVLPRIDFADGSVTVYAIVHLISSVADDNSLTLLWSLDPP